MTTPLDTAHCSGDMARMRTSMACCSSPGGCYIIMVGIPIFSGWRVKTTSRTRSVDTKSSGLWIWVGPRFTLIWTLSTRYWHIVPATLHMPMVMHCKISFVFVFGDCCDCTGDVGCGCLVRAFNGAHLCHLLGGDNPNQGQKGVSLHLCNHSRSQRMMQMLCSTTCAFEHMLIE